MAREMRHSGNEWIGEIPKEWIPARFRYSGCFIKGKLPATQNNENKGFPVIGASEMLGKEPRLYTEDSNIPMCSDEDILILWDGANAGIIANKCKGAVSSTAVKYSCTDKRFNKQYMFYLLKNAEPFFKSKVGGTTIPHMNTRYIDEYLCILPPLLEQRKIANYLDKVCGEVDEMIALQEQMIEELKAYKQSVITEAVTKGLNPGVSMKDSGIDWIGEVPECWEVKRLKEIFVLQTGTTPKDYEKGLETDVLVNWFTPSDVGEMNCELNGSQRNLSKVVVENEGIHLYPKGSLIFVAIGASAGKVGYANVEGYSNQQITALIPKENCYSKYCYYYMIADRRRIRDNAFFTTLPIINNGYLSGVKTLLPPIEEQQSIASYLDTKCAEIDALIAIKQAKIDEMKDYKKSVIYEYVTGKKEVV